jgi:hypothetical protein
MLGKLLGQGDAAGGSRIDGIVYCHLAVLVVQPGINVLSALLEDLLAEHDGRWRRVGVEVVLGYMTPGNSGPAIVAEMEYTCLDAKPATSE